MIAEEPTHLLAISMEKNLYGLQIRIGCLVSQNSQHRDNLAFVVKCVNMTCGRIKAGLRSSPAQPAGRSNKVALSCSSVRFSMQVRVARRARSLAACNAAIVVQSSPHQPAKDLFCKSWTQPFLTGQHVHQSLPNDGRPNPEIGLCRRSSDSVAT